MSELITVIVPVYNVELYLSKCVDSLIEQTYSNLEILLVNDGSNDKSGIICDQYAIKDKRVKAIHKKNGGLSDARNYGLDHTHGDYVAFIDSDDFVSNDYIEFLYLQIKEYTAEVAMCKFQRFTVEPNKSLEYDKKIEVLSGKEACLKLYSDDYVQTVIMCNKLYKTSLFSDVRFPVGKLYEDEGTSFKILYNANKVVYTNKPNYYYFTRQGSITTVTNLNIKRLDYYYIMEERIEFFKNKDQELYLVTLKRYFYDLFVLKYQMCKFKYKNEEMNDYIKLNKKRSYHLLMDLDGLSIKRKIFIKLSYFIPLIYYLYIYFLDIKRGNE